MRTWTDTTGKFRVKAKTRLLGITCRLGRWDNEQTVGRIKGVFDRAATPRGRDEVLIAREGYAVGAEGDHKPDSRRMPGLGVFGGVVKALGNRWPPGLPFLRACFGG